MTIGSNQRLYVAVFAVSALLGALLLSLGQTTFDNINCRSSEYGGSNFLAYCQSAKHGDYEHGALYYGLEPGLRDNIGSAKVIFLGSSHVQAAFSTKAVRAFFDKLNLRFFVMGFGYGEGSPFALPVLKRWGASPKVLVINADPFFLPEQKVSEPALEALEGRPALIWRLMQKMMFQRVHRILCAAVPFVCQESEPAIFRSARDGQWNWIGPYVAERSNPIDRAAQKKIAREELQKAKHWGEHFLTEVGLNRRCVVLTGTPSPTYDSIEFAESLARALKTSSIFPPLDGMATVDASHLNLASAERWSGQFLEALRPILQDCLPQ